MLLNVFIFLSSHRSNFLSLNIIDLAETSRGSPHRLQVVDLMRARALLVHLVDEVCNFLFEIYVWLMELRACQYSFPRTHGSTSIWAFPYVRLSNNLWWNHCDFLAFISFLCGSLFNFILDLSLIVISQIFKLNLRNLDSLLDRIQIIRQKLLGTFRLYQGSWLHFWDLLVSLFSW